MRLKRKLTSCAAGRSLHSARIGLDSAKAERAERGGVSREEVARCGPGSTALPGLRWRLLALVAARPSSHGHTLVLEDRHHPASARSGGVRTRGPQ
nr:unnamed protein product [Digitaria exilis]